MAESSENENDLIYGLSICTGLSVLLNLILLIWHNISFKSLKGDGRYLKHAFSCTTAAYILLSIGIILLALYNDNQSRDLCKVGGFFVLFAAQECFWLIAVSTLILLFWIRSSQRDVAHRTLLNSGLSSHKWSVPIFILILIVMCIILAILSFLPVTNVKYFDSELSDKAYLCVPLQHPGKTGWGYSTLIVVSLWIASIVTVTASVFCLIHIQTLKPFGANKLGNSRAAADAGGDDDMLMKWVMLITYGFDAILWLLVLTILSITYFSKGNALNRSNTRWGLGYMTSLVTLLHPVMVFILVLMRKKKWILQNCSQSESTNTSMACPKQLENMQKLANAWQVSIVLFSVQLEHRSLRHSRVPYIEHLFVSKFAVYFAPFHVKKQ